MEKQGRKTIPITPSLRLVPYYPAYETTLPWYQDAELCHQVDNQNRIYDLSILKNMYEYLNAHGDLFYIEYEGTLCGDLFVQCTVPGNVPLNRICAEGCRNVCLSAAIKRRNTP